MNEAKGLLAISSVMMFFILAVAATLPATTAGPEPPGRSTLYQLSETYNLSFNKPTFYDNTDPNYSNNKLENNTWEDIAIVVFLQDMNRVSIKENQGSGTNSVNCGDIYQTLFVPLNGTLLKSGTKQRILVEDFTATWCIYCTAVVGSMERMDHDSAWFPDKYVGFEWHSGGGTYGVGTALTVATSRASAYGLASGIPRYVIDGMDPYVGGSSSPNDTAVENRIKTSINNRMATAPITIDAKGGHDNSKCWVDFTITVQDSNFDNIKVEANAVLVQDAFPRRHGANNNAYLGYIANDHKKVRVFDIDGTPPTITDVLPAADSTLSGDSEISFNAADVDAPTRPIRKTVEVKKTDAATWSAVSLTGGKYIWKTNQMSGTTHTYPDGDYEIRITATDYWDEVSTVTVPVKVLNLDAPVIALNDLSMQEDLEDGTTQGVFDILWTASDDEDGSNVVVDLYYSRPAIDWTEIATDLPNTGSYGWDTMDPRAPDGDRYRVKAVVRDTHGMMFEIATNFEFAINNPDPPEVRLTVPVAGQELSGAPAIKWTAFDDEDESTMLKVDIYLSSDGGTTFQALVVGAPNSGTYKFDSTNLKDASTYRAKVVVRDTSGLSTEILSPVFSIYNNDPPECALTNPREDAVLTGTFDFKWTSEDEEDAPEALTYDLMYMFSTSSFWTELAIDEPNTGVHSVDTTALEEGDGIYTFRLVVKDSRKEMSSESRVVVRVYNPDAPIISERSLSPTPASKKATITWAAYDDDPAETDGLKAWISVSQRLATGSEIPAWDYVAEGIPNIGRYILDVTSLEDGKYKVMLEVYDCTETNLSAMHIFDMTVDNNDPPVVSFSEAPDPGSNKTGIVTFSWTGFDPEGKDLLYSVYYRPVGAQGWISLSQGLRVTTFEWNTSSLITDDYQFRIVGVDASTDKLEAEIITEPFHVYVAPKIIDDQFDDDEGDNESEEPAEDNTTIIIVLVIVLTLIILAALVLTSLVVMKKRKDAAQFPPPGGLMMPPLPPGPGLPPPQGVMGGPLPGHPQAPTLPPAPAALQTVNAPPASPAAARAPITGAPQAPQQPAVQPPPVQ